jgi:hypothetical protein
MLHSKRVKKGTIAHGFLNASYEELLDIDIR